MTMNHCIIIGNLTKDPETRTTPSGIPLCNFTVAVNRRQTANAGQPDADFFRVTAWRELGDICAKYLSKGRKVCVTGSVSANAYTAQDGSARAQIELTARDVEFITPKDKNDQSASYAPQTVNKTADTFVQVEDADLPF